MDPVLGEKASYHKLKKGKVYIVLKVRRIMTSNFFHGQTEDGQDTL